MELTLKDRLESILIKPTRDLKIQLQLLHHPTSSNKFLVVLTVILILFFQKNHFCIGLKKMVLKKINFYKQENNLVISKKFTNKVKILQVDQFFILG